MRFIFVILGNDSRGFEIWVKKSVDITNGRVYLSIIESNQRRQTMKKRTKTSYALTQSLINVFNTGDKKLFEMLVRQARYFGHDLFIAIDHGIYGEPEEIIEAEWDKFETVAANLAYWNSEMKPHMFLTARCG
jgi:hypothetical protein